MKEFELKYGCNPNQKPSRVFMADGSDLPFEVVNGRPGYINFLDALNSWQLVKELKEALGLPAAASFKHVSPAGAAVGLPLSDKEKKACFVDDIEGLDDSPLACAYARARGTDRMCSFGDWIALSDVCDVTTAKIIKREVSDGVIAPGYTDDALELLCQKKKGGYNIVKIDTDYVPPEKETKQVFGVTFEQGHNFFSIDRELLGNVVTDRSLLPDGENLPEEAVRDLIVALITLKYTQSNSVCYAHKGQAIGVGAGQQSRVHCTRLAGGKADTWFLRQHDKVLGLPFRADIKRPDRDNVIDAYINKNEEDCCAEGVWQKYFTEQPERFTDEEQRAYLDSIKGVSCGSDAFFPFFDNVQRAAASGVSYIAQPGGSIRDDAVIDKCNELGISMTFTGMRLFHH
ncbi:MAG: phosphoribosylaminoimidazolecarboxamide formyltransferase [Mogibacterium sp.]|nr:phosphoribosylaminoimidazolecarboxamide formyltransferase [Mogibacterium sp.]